MADEYIRKQDAVDLVNKISNLDLKAKGGICVSLANLEKSDVVPVVHAYWIRHDDADIVEGYYVPEYECSKCGAWNKDDSDFCPDCGAKMDMHGEV